MLYKYANVSVLESECPDSTGPAPAGALPSAGSLPPEHSHFCLFFFSLDLFFVRYCTRPRFYFSFYHVVIPKLCSFSLFYNNGGHCPEAILVCI